MKRPILFICLLCFVLKGLAQQPDRQLIQSEAKLLTPKANGYETIQTYSQGVKGSQFYPVVWSHGELQTSDNLRFNFGYLFMLDKVHQQLFIEDTATLKIMNIDKVQIKNLRITSDKKDHIFGIADTYLNSKEGIFCEFLVENNNKYSLIKTVTTKYIRADNAGFAKMKDGEFGDEFVDNTTYYILRPSLSAKKVTFKDKSIQNAFKEKDTADDYLIKNEFIKKDEYFLINIVNYMNESLK